MRAVYLSRHNAVHEKYDKRFRGHSDYPLSEKGKRKSIGIADFLLAQKIDKVITTGLMRTDFIGKYLTRHGVHHEIDERLQEIHFGLFEGKTWQEIEREFPMESEMYVKDWGEMQFPQGESIAQVLKRVTSAWNELMSQQFGKIAIIGHAASNACLLSYIQKKELNDIGVQPLGNLLEILIKDEVEKIFAINDVAFSFYKKLSPASAGRTPLFP